MSNFIEDCISGDALVTEIDDYIDKWHDGDSLLPLDEFLGMSSEEYSAFVADEDVLALIVTAHKENIPFDLIFQSELLSMAARSDSQDKAEQLNRWLKHKGLWE